MVKRIEYNNGLIEYRNENGEIHREDGPSIFFPDGTEIWHKNGQRHREDGPAIISPSGRKYWCLNGDFHREDGPAVIYPDGRKEWWLNGNRYSFDKWIKKVNISNEDKIEIYLKFA